jgi:hypothetical protein
MPGASSEAIKDCRAARAFEGLNYYYNNMRRDDFCEAALLVLKSGTLEDGQFNLACYVHTRMGIE